MVATLRSLSLLQVVKDLKKKEDGGGYQIPDIPKELVKDIMKSFDFWFYIGSGSKIFELLFIRFLFDLLKKSSRKLEKPFS